jgi:hypothetical protein
MALRFVDRAQAIPRNTSKPRREKSRSIVFAEPPRKTG